MHLNNWLLSKIDLSELSNKIKLFFLLYLIYISKKLNKSFCKFKTVKTILYSVYTRESYTITTHTICDNFPLNCCIQMYNIITTQWQTQERWV